MPRYKSPADHIEIDKQRQILIVVRNGQTSLISPVSTAAGIAGYYTPVGRFAIGRKVPGYDPSPLGVLYKPMYFYGGYAIHGNPSVPPYPASHGCIRVPNFVADRLYVSEPYGEAVRLLRSGDRFILSPSDCKPQSGSFPSAAANSSGVTLSRNFLNSSTRSSSLTSSPSNSIADSSITVSSAKIGASARTARAIASEAASRSRAPTRPGES